MRASSSAPLDGPEDAGMRPAVSTAPQRVEIGAGLRGAAVWHAYRTTVAGLFDVGLPEGADLDAFALRSVIWQGVHASLHHSWGSAQIMRRGPEQIARGADQLMLYTQLDGHVAYRADAPGGERAGRIGPGDVILYDHTRPLVSVADGFENLVLIVNRDVAPAALLSGHAHGLHLPAGSGLADLLAAGLAFI